MQVGDHPSPSEIFLFCQVRPRLKSVPFRTRPIPFNLSQLELAYILLGLGWIGFRLDLFWSKICDDGNTANWDGEDGCKKVLHWYLML